MGRRFLPIVALTFAIATGTSAASSSLATTLSATGEIAAKIAFESDRSGTWNVYLANADGSALLGIPVAHSYLPVWSPDGTKIAVTDGASIYVADAEGKNVQRVTKGYDQAWSPDGTKLAFVRELELYVANSDGSGARRLTRLNEGDINTAAELPSWSPDGTRIAFEKINGLFVIRADGTGVTRLSKRGVEPGSTARPEWSPSGSSIAFVADTCCAEGDIEFYEVDYGDPPRLSVIELANRSVSPIGDNTDDVFGWSPDGTRIAFSHPISKKENAPSEVYTTALGIGVSTYRVTRSVIGEDSWGPVWSPDGEWLTYNHGRLPASVFYGNSSDVATIRVDGTGGRLLTQAFPSGGTNINPASASGTIEPSASPAASPAVAVGSRSLASKAVIFELAASGSRSAVLSSLSDEPAFWKPPATRLTRARASDLESDDYYGLVMTDDYAAWFSCYAYGLSDPATDVSLVLTSRKTGRSVELASVERSGHDPSYATGPRLAGDGSLLVYNRDNRGSKLFRVDTRSAKPKLRLLARKVAVVDVNGGHIVGWRGSRTLVTLRSDGRVLAKAAFNRGSTTSVRLEGSRLFTTVSDKLSQTNLRGKLVRVWKLVDEGGRRPALAGVQGDLAVYVSGVAVHVLRLSSGRDAVLQLKSPGKSIDVDLTQDGLFYAYNAAYTSRPGNLGYVSLPDLANLTE